MRGKLVNYPGGKITGKNMKTGKTDSVTLAPREKKCWVNMKLSYY